jgi:hypothetical protein
VRGEPVAISALDGGRERWPSAASFTPRAASNACSFRLIGKLHASIVGTFPLERRALETYSLTAFINESPSA